MKTGCFLHCRKNDVPSKKDFCYFTENHPEELSHKREAFFGVVLLRFQWQLSLAGEEDIRQVFFDINVVCLCCVDD